MKRTFFRWALCAFAIVVVAVIGWHQWRSSEPRPMGGAPTARLISPQQYLNAVRDIFGEDIQAETSFPLPQRRYGLLALGAEDTMMTPGLLDAFDRSARSIASQVMDERHRDLFVPCTVHATEAPDDTCASQFFAQVGRLLYRRSLSSEERALYVTAAHAAAASAKDFYAGLAHGLAALLVSPQFLYLMETTESDSRHSGRYRLDASSKATRLSLFLWNSLPDAELLKSVDTGKLNESAELDRQVTRMLARPDRLERGARAFFSDVLQFDRFATLTKDSLIYPTVTPEVIRSAQEQALRLVVDQLLVRRADYRDLFTTPHSFVDPTLAPLEHLPSNGNSWQRVTRQSNGSAGLLTTLGFLAVYSHPGRSSPTLRGRAIREDLLCQKVPDPPPNVDFKNFEASFKTVKTARERLSQHATDPVCAGCHQITDPIGLALENFDGGGQFRDLENGAAIDANGQIDGHPFADIGSFGQALHGHPSLAPCLASRLFAYGVGRKPEPTDRPSLAYFTKHFEAEGYRYPDLLRRIAVSEAFYAVTTANQET